MKSPFIAAASLLAIASMLTGCSLGEPGSTSKPAGQRLFTRAGEVMLFVYAREIRPDSINALMEKPKDRGFSELNLCGAEYRDAACVFPP